MRTISEPDRRTRPPMIETTAYIEQPFMGDLSITDRAVIFREPISETIKYDYLLSINTARTLPPNPTPDPFAETHF